LPLGPSGVRPALTLSYRYDIEATDKNFVVIMKDGKVYKNALPK
jgi:hypothetical protein